jgi:hypothetical protein
MVVRLRERSKDGGIPGMSTAPCDNLISIARRLAVLGRVPDIAAWIAPEEN